jgi:hypothetical protein
LASSVGITADLCFARHLYFKESRLTLVEPAIMAASYSSQFWQKKNPCPAKSSLRRGPKFEQGTNPFILTLVDLFLETTVEAEYTMPLEDPVAKGFGLGADGSVVLFLFPSLPTKELSKSILFAALVLMIMNLD